MSSFEAELLAINENSNRHAARSAGWVLEHLKTAKTASKTRG